jgi:hypothetical protein
VRAGRLLGSSLDAAVRATRSTANHRAVAARTTELFRENAALTLEVHPAQLRSEDGPALEASASEGRWLLPAFMSGLRTLRPREDLTIDDTARLAEELAAVRADVASVAALHDWLWADGAEGFEVQLHPSFVEVMEEVAETERLATEDGAVARAIAPLPASVVQQMQLRDADRAALREELEVPLAEHQHALETGAYALAEADVDALRRACDDGNAWILAEIDAVLALGELRDAVPPARLARRIQSRMAAAFDPRFLTLIASLRDEDDPYRKALAAALETEETGAMVARHMRLDDESAVQALARFAVTSAPAVCHAVGRRLLDRAAAEEEAARALAWLLGTVGLPRFRSWIDEPSLDGARTTALLRAAEAARILVAGLVELLAAVPPASAVAAVTTVDPALRTRLVTAMISLAACADPASTEALARVAIADGHSPVLCAIGDRLLAGGAEGWTGRGLYAVCGALVATGHGAEYVVPLAKARDAGERVRLIAIDCVAERPDLAAEVSKWRIGEVLDPPAVRDRLLQMRARAGREDR